MDTISSNDVANLTKRLTEIKAEFSGFEKFFQDPKNANSDSDAQLARLREKIGQIKSLVQNQSASDAGEPAQRAKGRSTGEIKKLRKGIMNLIRELA